jgi:hypothetical protein
MAVVRTVIRSWQGGIWGEKHSQDFRKFVSVPIIGDALFGIAWLMDQSAPSRSAMRPMPAASDCEAFCANFVHSNEGFLVMAKQEVV